MSPSSKQYHLPDEIVQLIISFVPGVPEFIFPHTFTLNTCKPVRSRGYQVLCSALLVCKQWKQITEPSLYASTVLSKAEHVLQLYNTLQATDSRPLGKLIKKLRVDDSFDPEALLSILSATSKLDEIYLPLSVSSTIEYSGLSTGLKCINPSRLVLLNYDPYTVVLRGIGIPRQQSSFLQELTECFPTWTKLKHIFMDLQSRKFDTPGGPGLQIPLDNYISSFSRIPNLQKITFSPECFSGPNLRALTAFAEVIKIDIFVWPEVKARREYILGWGTSNNGLMHAIVASNPALKERVRLLNPNGEVYEHKASTSGNVQGHLSL